MRRDHLCTKGRKHLCAVHSRQVETVYHLLWDITLFLSYLHSCGLLIVFNPSPCIVCICANAQLGCAIIIITYLDRQTKAMHLTLLHMRPRVKKFYAVNADCSCYVLTATTISISTSAVHDAHTHMQKMSSSAVTAVHNAHSAWSHGMCS